MVSSINSYSFNFLPRFSARESYGKISTIFYNTLSKVDHVIRQDNPVTGARNIRFVPTSIENSLGKCFYPFLILQGGGLLKKENVKYGNYTTLVKNIGKELATHCPRKDPAIKWQFEVLHDRGVMNAWCYCGGKIAITHTLIKKMDKDHETYGLDREPTLQEKIAAVLAHEVTHEAAGHLSHSLLYSFLELILFTLLLPLLVLYFSLLKNQSIYDTIQFLWNTLLLHKSRGHELEADKGSIYLLQQVAKTETNTIGLKSDSLNAAIWIACFFKNHTDHNDSGSEFLNRFNRFIDFFFLTHPDWDKRSEANQRTVEQLLQRPDPNDPYLAGYKKISFVS